MWRMECVKWNMKSGADWSRASLREGGIKAFVRMNLHVPNDRTVAKFRAPNMRSSSVSINIRLTYDQIVRIANRFPWLLRFCCWETRHAASSTVLDLRFGMFLHFIVATLQNLGWGIFGQISKLDYNIQFWIFEQICGGSPSSRTESPS